MDNYVCAIGGINADIKGISAGLTEDSHPGKIIITGGGVARNVSENLARLGLKVYLLGCTGNDEFGNFVIASAAKAGVLTEHVFVTDKARTGIYLCVSDKSGKLNYAVNDMKDSLALVNEDYINGRIDIINKSSLIFADANLDDKVLDLILYNANKKGIPVFIDSVSAAKAVKIKSLSGRTDFLSVNSAEFEVLLGAAAGEPFKDTAISRNIDNIILRKGADGALLISGNKIIRAEAGYAEVVEPNGAGDAFNSGFIYGLLYGKSKEESLECGVFAARSALESETSAGGNLSAEELEKNLKGIRN